MVSNASGLPDTDTLVQWTRAFVRYPSPQTDLFEQEPAVQGFISECVAPLMNELGLRYQRDQIGNLFTQFGNGNGPHLLLMGYAMTHPAATMAAPYDPRVIDAESVRCLRGRGVSEQKGALAAALGAFLAATRASSLSGTVTFAVTTAGETGRHDAAASLVEALPMPPSAAVIVIGTSGRVSLANKGRIDAIVRVEGRAAHSSTPWHGTNALEGLRRIMNALAEAGPDHGRHPDLGPATLTPTFVESAPRATHTIQSRACLTLDRRLLPGQDPDRALEEIVRLTRLEAPWRVDVDRGPFMYPSEIAEQARLLRAIDAGCGDAGLAPPGRFYSHGALDAGFFTERGTEATMWGPGDMEMWHTDEEAVPVADIRDAAKGYLGLIGRYLEARWRLP